MLRQFGAVSFQSGLLKLPLIAVFRLYQLQSLGAKFRLTKRAPGFGMGREEFYFFITDFASRSARLFEGRTSATAVIKPVSSSMV